MPTCNMARGLDGGKRSNGARWDISDKERRRRRKKNKSARKARRRNR